MDDYDENQMEGEGEEEEEEEMGEAGEAGEDDEPPPPPPPEEDKELLFLIEFLVDTMEIIPENMNTENIDPCALQGPTSIALTFLHFPPMIISEKDLDSDRITGGTVIEFNSGKSLMFALTESQFEEPPPVYLGVQATKDMPHAFRFSTLLIGKTKIQLSELFKQVFDKYDENPNKTVSKSIKDKYDLIGEKNKPAGEITIYIRLTCLGENIVTEFQKGEDPTEPLLFKNEESKKMYECKQTEKSEEAGGRIMPGWGDESRRRECEEAGDVFPPDPEDENFEEIFAEINGSAIRIKVEKSRRKDPKKLYNVSEFCDCDIPLPQDLVAGMSDLSLSPASEGSINMNEGSGTKPDKRVGVDAANQLVFQVPPVETLARPTVGNSYTYNVNTCHEEDVHGHPGQKKFRIITDNNPDGPPAKMPNDPEKDVFILRIIKRGRADKGKNALDLEFKTPKEKIVPPPKIPYMKDLGVGPDSKKKDKGKKR